MGGGGSLPSGRDYETIGEVVRRQLRGEEAAPGVRNVFISFASEDKPEVELLRGQAKNETSDLEFKDYSLKVPFDSARAEYIRAGIRERIEKCSVTLVYLSEDAASSKWVDWEVRESHRLGKGIVAVHKGDAPPSRLPKAVADCGARVVRWSPKTLTQALDDAASER